MFFHHVFFDEIKLPGSFTSQINGKQESEGHDVKDKFGPGLIVEIGAEKFVGVVGAAEFFVVVED